MSSDKKVSLASVRGRSGSKWVAHGFISKSGDFFPLVKLRGGAFRDQISLDCAEEIEADFEGFLSAAIDAQTDPAVEERIRAAHIEKLRRQAGADDDTDDDDTDDDRPRGALSRARRALKK
jgi:hypothetical protein